MYKLYAFGSNGSGQLGLGHEDDCSELQLVDLGDHAEHTGICTIAAGGNHSLILLDDGRVLACGSNKHGQCGGETCDLRPVRFFSSVAIGEQAKIKQIAATWTASIFVDSEQHVYTTGTGTNGELGLGKGIEQVSSPTILTGFPPPDSTILSLSSCVAHTVAVLSTGEVFGWGKGRKGQLGDPCDDVWHPRRVEGIPFHATKAACGKDFTCILGTNGEIYMLGPNKLDRFSVKEHAPTRVPAASESTSINASWGTILLSWHQSGQLQYDAWGRNDHGQKPPLALPTLAQVCAGSEHFLAISTSREVLAWGWGEHGNCASPVDDAGDVKGRFNVVWVPRQAVAIFAGCATSFVVTSGQYEME